MNRIFAGDWMHKSKGHILNANMTMRAEERLKSRPTATEEGKEARWRPNDHIERPGGGLGAKTGPVGSCKGLAKVLRRYPFGSEGSEGGARARG